MKQYYGIKEKHPDALLLFRVGDFYETFGEDAIKTAEILGITLTRRANGAASYVELAGFPHHAIDTYLPRLVRAGQRVAICDQLEDPKLTKTIVKRGITELVTPGVSFNDSILERKENHFLAAVHIDKQVAGVAFLDISTGEFLTAEGSFEYIDKLLSNFQPKEVLFERSKEKLFEQYFGTRFYSYKLDDWIFTSQHGNEKLQNHFKTSSLKGFGIDTLTQGIIAAGAILYYLETTQHTKLQHISCISRIIEDHYVWLDKFTIRNLELFNTISENGRSLVDVIDRSVSPMGARMLKRWIALPLKECKPIQERLDTVDFLISAEDFKDQLIEQLRIMGDLERIISRVAAGKVSPREVMQLRYALDAIVVVKELIGTVMCPPLLRIAEQLNACRSIADRIARELMAEPPMLVIKGNVIAAGVSAELDELRAISHSGKDFILQIQQKEAERTNIPSLKISFNNVFGYYIEVRNTHKDKVPPEWIRKQTLVSAERYITEELKEYESKVLGAEEKILNLEVKLFGELVSGLFEYIEAIQLNASLIGRLDCLISFACIAIENKYVKPIIDDSTALDIKDGRHPVIEKMLATGNTYIANDVYLDTDDQQIIIITGPNMSGKSALLRQTALIVLMAQMGSFVPAKAARIGLVDKIFTRVGASDNISQGESTFMVEMNEAASILNNVSPQSLILLDELGRGTSTYDGISIAWAIAEYLHEHPAAKAKTLFATHYHELNEMEKHFHRIRNFNVSVKELENKVIFLRKLKPGGSEHSFGIHVAQMAGMPKSIIKRANEVLHELEGDSSRDKLTKPTNEISAHREGMQLSFFQLEDPLLKQIRDEIHNLDINSLTPLEALNKLSEIKRVMGLK